MSIKTYLGPHVKFKGIKIPPLTCARRGALLSLIDPAKCRLFDIAVCIYGCLCDRGELIDAMEDRKEFNRKVGDWMDEIEFTENDAKEAAEIFQKLIDRSKEGEVEPVKTISELPPSPDELADEFDEGND